MQSKLDFDKGARKLVEAMTLPIITWPRSEDTLTEEQKMRVTTERFAKNARLDFTDEATDFEVCIYMMTASLSGPLDHTGYKIYMYAFSKVYDQEQVRMITGGEDITLDLQEEREYERMKRWLYTQQVKGRKGKRQ